jgi:branched-chain amino acid transport system substrate-binding protein
VNGSRNRWRFFKGSLFVTGLLAALLAVLVGASGAAGAPGAGKSVKIAISGPLSGAGAFSAPIALGAKAYFEYTNEHGGVNGYKFDLSVLDNQITSTGGALNAKEALASKPFAMVIGGSAAYAGAASVIRQDAPDLPVFAVANAAVISAAGLRNAHGLFPNYTRECYLFAKYSKEKLKLKRIAILWQTDAVGQDTGKNCPGFAKRQGFANVTTIPVPFNTTDFGPIAAQIKDSGAQGVLEVLSQTVLAGVQKAVDAIGFKAQWMGYTGTDGAYVKVAGSLAEGLLASNALEPLNATTPEMKLFTTEITKRLGSSGVVTIGESGWTVAAIIVRGVKDATTGGKALTQANFLAAVNKLNGQQIGVSPSVSYVGRDHTTIAKTVTVYKVVGGKFIPIQKNVPLPAH